MVEITDTTGMNQETLEAGRNVINSIIDEFFTAEEKRRFNRKGVKIRIEKLPPDIAGQNIGRDVLLDPDTVTRADGITEDVVVHEKIHAQNRFLEEKNPKKYLRKESISDTPADFKNDTEIEEAITEAMTTARLHRFDKTSGKPIPKTKGSVKRRYNRHQPGHSARDEINDYTEWLLAHNREDFQELLNQTFGESENYRAIKDGFMIMWNDFRMGRDEDLPFSLMRYSGDSAIEGNGNPLLLNMLRWDSVRIANAGFMFEGTQITNPFYDESMRFEVDPEEYYGQAYRDWRFRMWNSGMSDQEIADFQAGLRGTMLAINTPLEGQYAIQTGDRYWSPIMGEDVGQEGWRIFEDEDGVYELSSRPIDVNRIEEAVEEEGYSNWAAGGLKGLDERGGEVIEQKDAWIAQVVENNRGFLEESIIGIYDSEEAMMQAIREYQQEYPMLAQMIANGQVEITGNQVSANDMFDTYRKWPYLMNHKNTLYLKTGMKGKQILYRSIVGAWDGSLVGQNQNAPTFLNYNWVEGIEPSEYEGAFEVGGAFDGIATAGAWKDAYYYARLKKMKDNMRRRLYHRKINGKSFIGTNNSMTKNDARLVANIMRFRGARARVIPSARGWRVYVGNGA